MKFEYKDCPEFHECNRLTNEYYLKGDYVTWFQGHLKIAEETGFHLAECQVGWAFWSGTGVGVDLNKAYYWTKLAAEQGDPDAINNIVELKRLLQIK